MAKEGRPKMIKDQFSGQELNFGQRAADYVTEKVGSWTFILVFMATVFVWMILNVVALLQHWDPYPFIFLNLVLSCLSAIQAPIILMSQNRQNEIDGYIMRSDYKIDRRTKGETTQLLERLDRIEKKLGKLK